MDSSSIRGRFSLSTTNLSSPIAESTCLNGVSSRSKFNWGEGTISSRSRNNSLSVNEQSSSMSKNLTNIPTKVSMSPSSRIDPRTYVDIHSNGLASRIVKYHDNSARLNRSLSMTNLYNKPGQFPVVHLKKNEQQYKAKKTKNLSMTRIAAPEKSVFHGNTLSSILRSGSIVGLQKSDEEISRENRPILHPPPTENEMAPTRSVLEVLKEISRKRINSDEMDGTELTKKQCKETEQDSTLNTIHRTQTKRQREITNSSSNSQISPEQQVIKKRMCNYNNDIMSSLSSSMASVNKRKMLEIQSQKRTSFDSGSLSANTVSGDYEISRNEKLRCVANSEIQNLAPSSKSTQMNSISSAPYQSASELDGDCDTRNGIVMRRASEPALSSTKPKLTLFNKNYDEVPTILGNDNAESKEDGDLCGIQFVKPKKSSSLSSGGLLLMEKTKKSKLALMLSGLKGELDEGDEVDAEQPKQEENSVIVSSVTTQVISTSNISSSTSLFTTTPTLVVTSQPSVTSKSSVEDSANKKSEVTSSSNLTSIAVTSTTSTASSGFKINPIAVQSTSSIAAAQVTVPTITTSSSISTITSTSASTPVIGGFSFGLSAPKTSEATTTSALILPESSTTSQANGSTLTTTSSPVALSGKNSIMGIKSFGFGPATTQPSVSTTPTFNFGAPTTTTIPAVVSATKEPAATNTFGILTKSNESSSSAIGQPSGTTLPTFSFGSLAEAKTITNTLTTQTASAAPTSALTTNFDSQKNTWSTPTNSTPANINPINSIPVFGGAGGVSNLPHSTTSTNSTGGFSFSNSSMTGAENPIFGNTATASTTSTNSNTTFSFSANKTPPNPTNKISTFTFGAGASSSPAAGAAPNTASTFGSNIPAATAPNTALTFGSTVPPAAANSSPQNVFGNTPNLNAKPSNAFTFGSSGPSAPAQNGVFAFSSTEKPSTTAPTGASSVGGFSFNNPSSSSINFGKVAEPSKNIFGSVAPAVADTKPAFNFGSSAPNPSTDKPAVFGGAANIFGAANSTPSTPQSSAFTFSSTSNATTNQGQSTPNPFAPAQTSNITGSVGPSTVSNSIFGAPSSAVPPVAQSSAFTFGASSNNTKQEAMKPAGGFVFGSTSSIGSNASKPTVDMSKTFVFGDGNTIIKPAPSSTNVFGNSATSSSINGGGAGTTENKMFSFGSNAGGSNNTFTAGSQTMNPAPAFNFGGSTAPTNNAAQAPNGNYFTQPEARPFKKATRRLHKT
ncbi:nuclear pore complex protein DDB_G0274915 [Eupeodes corollae]|uniref:nuclear pore complex protein DDB_G0274915 n=1 Tax=Eupeodes corollae TaxID=290404 RepID=UPI00248FC709|nr:nuclear pore complex protein DDB_G0274915 [Eupeodes corollae]